jgi:glutathione synthase
LPKNEAGINFAKAFIKAWDSYGQKSAVILILKEDRTINICDQRAVSFAISMLRPDIRIIRRSFAELRVSAVLKDNQLLFVDKFEIALVYYRYGYDPTQYSGQADWDTRLLIEKSKAIKCPSINYHLAGVKKIQQILSDREVLGNFLEPSRADKVYETFAGLWGFDLTESGNKTVERALSNPERYVMKPQREGGGHNVYGQDILKELMPIKDSQSREAYILMELIKPPIISNLLIGPNISINGDEPFQQIVSELGIYGAIFGDENGVDFNEECGHVLRSKFSGVNEGGIAAGFGAIDSPYLYDC